MGPLVEKTKLTQGQLALEVLARLKSSQRRNFRVPTSTFIPSNLDETSNPLDN